MSQEYGTEKKELHIDWFLQNLAHLADEGGVGLPITLMIPSGTVSGNMISGAQYFRELAKKVSEPLLETPNLESLAKDLYDFIHQNVEIYDRERKEDEMTPEDLPVFIHLENAKFYLVPENPIPSNDGILWRGKISSVSGFFMGKINKD